MDNHPLDREKLYGQADFRLFVPYKPGQYVAILGSSIELAQSLMFGGVFPILITKEKNLNTPIGIRLNAESLEIPIAENSIDHIFVPEFAYPQTQTHFLLRELTRILKTGGWIFLGVKNKESIESFFKGFFSKDQSINSEGGVENSFAYSIVEWKGLLSAFGYRIKHFYGVGSNLKYPGLYVLLDRPEILRAFYKDMFSPYSWKDRFFFRIAFMLCSLGLQRTLFSHFCIVAQCQLSMERNRD